MLCSLLSLIASLLEFKKKKGLALYVWSIVALYSLHPQMPAYRCRWDRYGTYYTNHVALYSRRTSIQTVGYWPGSENVQCTLQLAACGCLPTLGHVSSIRMCHLVIVCLDMVHAFSDKQRD